MKNLLEWLLWSLQPVIQISPTLVAEWICSWHNCFFVLLQPAIPTECHISADPKKIYFTGSKCACFFANFPNQLTIGIADTPLGTIRETKFSNFFFKEASCFNWLHNSVDLKMANCAASADFLNMIYTALTSLCNLSTWEILEPREGEPELQFSYFIMNFWTNLSCFGNLPFSKFATLLEFLFVCYLFI